MAAWELRARYMTALQALSRETERERDRAQIDQVVGDSPLRTLYRDAILLRLQILHGDLAVTEIRTSHLILYPGELSAVRRGAASAEKIKLGPVVYKMLEVLTENAGVVISPSKLYRLTYDTNFLPDNHQSIIQNMVSTVRKKLTSVDIIVNHRGSGYTVEK